MEVSGIKCHDTLARNMKQKLAYGTNANYAEWKKDIKEKFVELLGLDEIELNAAKDSKFEIEKVEQKEGYKQIRFTIESEIDAIVSCYILIPDDCNKKRPVVITLQGHSTGFHNSIGETKFPEDKDYMPRGAFAVQAVKEGYVAVAIEQRGMGERSSIYNKERKIGSNSIGWCFWEQMSGIVLGRTLIGERCFDIKCTIDALENFKDVCDLDKIVITGNSGGGTASYYAACYDQRIKATIPSCAFCPYPDSILLSDHCACNYVPNSFKYFDMQDLACLIAPRKISVIAGKKDEAFLIDGVRRGYQTVKKIYEQVGALENCNLIETEMGHWWCVDIVWPEIKRIINDL